MGLVTIKTRQRSEEERGFLHNGLKPFFLLAAAQAVVSMGWWVAAYTFQLPLPTSAASPFQLHAHELVYGFTLAVVAGFLLAALPEWTNISTVSGWKLALLVILWVVPRVAFFGGPSLLRVAATFDLLFSCALVAAITHPIIVSRSWRQSGIVAKVTLLGVGNTCFYLGAFDRFPYGLYLSSYGGLYIVISLILTVGGRVLPGFIQNALERDAIITAPRWLATASMLLFVGFFILELAEPGTSWSRYLALCLGIATSIRLYRWYAPEIWRRPLLWGLYLSFASIALGFLLFATIPYTGASQSLTLHAFTIGGIGMATLAMMIRAALGHYGGDIRNPPKLTSVALCALVVSEFFRVAMPLLFPAQYRLMIAAAQVSWLIAYVLLMMMLLHIFRRPRS